MGSNQKYGEYENILAPYRALDLTNEKGLLCGKILADLGADVIKIEKPGGDPARNIGPFYQDIPDPEKSLFWFAYNTNKRGITLNIETADGRGIFKRLIETTDVVIESFDPGYLNRLGLSYSELSKLNPRLIMTSITAFGQTGPYSGFKYSDIVAWAMGSIMSQCGDPERPPVQSGFPQAFLNAAADGAEGTMVALYHRELTGEAQHVDVSAEESCIWATNENVLEWDGARLSAKRPGHLLLRPSGIHCPVLWECKDGYVAMFLIGGLPGARTNRALTEWMDSKGMAPEYMKNKDWEHWDFDSLTQDELDTVKTPIAKFFKTLAKHEFQQGVLERGIQLQPVYGPDETMQNPQLIARDFWVNIEHEELENVLTYPGAFAKFSETPMKVWRRAPRIGEHNEEIYIGELGFSKEELVILKMGGIV
jgi:crotonobetainyl-CoA:carnitine CoA-transferase CaiB-like acyl-CoA transferase